MSAVRALAARQHGVVARAQLMEIGLNSDGIRHRVERGRLFRVQRQVYALHRSLTPHGHWMAAVLSCGPATVLSHLSAAELWGVISASGPKARRDRPSSPGFRVEVSVARRTSIRRSGFVVHRRTRLPRTDVTVREAIPVTTPACTLIDIATRLRQDRLERAVNEADRLGLIDPDRLRAEVARASQRPASEQTPQSGSSPVATRRPGVAILRELLDRRTFVLTDSELERRFLPLAERAGMGRPETGRMVNGFRVDFFWPDLGLVVETDGLTYHRTPAQQARDRLRDQAHTAAGLTALRFTHAQVRFEPGHVAEILGRVAARLRTGPRTERRRAGSEQAA